MLVLLAPTLARSLDLEVADSPESAVYRASSYVT